MDEELESVPQEEVVVEEKPVAKKAPAPVVVKEPEPLVLVLDEASVPRWLKDLNDRRRGVFDVVRLTGFGMDNLNHANLLVDLAIAARIGGGQVIVPEAYADLVEARGLQQVKGFKEKGFFAFQ